MARICIYPGDIAASRQSSLNSYLQSATALAAFRLLDGTRRHLKC